MLNEIKQLMLAKLKEWDYKIKSIEKFEDFGYFIITDRGTFCITFKGEWYKNYGFHFNEKGMGQVASLDILQECLKRGDALFCFGLNGLNIYCINPKLFLESGKEVSHLENHIAVSADNFKKFDAWLEEEYLDWC